MNWLFRDPLRGVFSWDVFPYRRAEGEIEVDFMYKSVMYLIMLGASSAFFLEGGYFVYLAWLGINGLRSGTHALRNRS